METDGGKKKTRAIALLSGGLDSTLTIKMLLDQGIDVIALNFTSVFCTCTPKTASCHIATSVARELGVELKTLVKGLDYLKIVENPRHGRGRGMNPCIDCRIYMLRRSAEVMRETGAAFVATGEVLGQRPMSQHLAAIKLIEKESGLAGLIVRPLSAALLAPSKPELDGLVDRSRLLAIQGRTRRVQLEMARTMGVETFSCAAGGCLLTDPAIGRRVADMFHHCPGYDMPEVRLLTVGRHYRLRPALKAIVSRADAEGQRMEALAGPRLRMELADMPGPTLVACGDVTDDDLPALARLLAHHQKKLADDGFTVKIVRDAATTRLAAAGRLAPAEIESWRI